MSAQTKAELEQAVAAHFCDEHGDGAMLTGFVVSMCGMTPDSSSEEKTIYGQDTATGQPFHSTLGLLKIALWEAENYWADPE